VIEFVVVPRKEGVARLKRDNNSAQGKRVKVLNYMPPERVKTMSKHLNPLQKEFLIHKYKSGSTKMQDFCAANGVSITSFKKWCNQYNECGLAGLARADAALKDVFPEGADTSTEALKREILKLRIEVERLKKTTLSRRTSLGKWSMFV